LDFQIPFGNKTLVMGIINITPDSFYGGSRKEQVNEALRCALEFEQEGADILDIGGESTRPGAEMVDTDQEIRRVIPVIEGIRKKSNIPISVDTTKSEVARRSIECGAQIINDISGLTYSRGMEKVASETGVYLILMHMRGKPSNMQDYTFYGNLVEEVHEELSESVFRALKAGVKKEKIIIDPGIGFAKTAEQNLILIKNIPRFKKSGYPVMLGLSRKSFLGFYTGLEVNERLLPTVAVNAISIFLGADIIRVHDVKEGVITAKIVDAIKNSS